MTDDQRKHLEMIQTIIARLATNSFAVKGWSITLASALLALTFKDLDWHFAILFLFPVSLFWLQDAYFLHRERLFRRLYEAVRHAAVTGQVDGPSPFSMNADTYLAEMGSVARVFFSGPLLIFHGGLAIFIVLGICVAGLRGTPSLTASVPTSATSTPSQGKVP